LLDRCSAGTAAQEDLLLFLLLVSLCGVQALLGDFIPRWFGQVVRAPVLLGSAAGSLLGFSCLVRAVSQVVFLLAARSIFCVLALSCSLAQFSVSCSPIHEHVNADLNSKFISLHVASHEEQQHCKVSVSTTVLRFQSCSSQLSEDCCRILSRSFS
jgi:hypothetical protein